MPTVTWTFKTTQPTGTYYWTNSGTTTGSDFSDGLNSGSFTVSGTHPNRQGVITRTLATDEYIESSETIIMQVRKDSTSGTILITADPVTIAESSAAGAAPPPPPPTPNPPPPTFTYTFSVTPASWTWNITGASTSTLNSTLLSALSNTFSSNNADQTSIELIFYNSGRLTLTAYDSNATATTLTPGGNIDDFWITGSGSTPGNNYWMRITRLVGSLYVTPSTGWVAMTTNITISATGYPTFGQEGKWNIEIATDSAGSNIVGTISNMRFLPNAFNPNPSGG